MKEEEENSGADGSSLARNDVLGDAQNVQGGSESDRRRGLEKSFQKPSFFSPPAAHCVDGGNHQKKRRRRNCPPTGGIKNYGSRRSPRVANMTRRGRLQFQQLEI